MSLTGVLPGHRDHDERTAGSGRADGRQDRLWRPEAIAVPGLVGVSSIIQYMGVMALTCRQFLCNQCGQSDNLMTASSSWYYKYVRSNG